MRYIIWNYKTSDYIKDDYGYVFEFGSEADAEYYVELECEKDIKKGLKTNMQDAREDNYSVEPEPVIDICDECIMPECCAENGCYLE